MTYLIAFLVAILILVFFHELGHFLAARWSGVRVLTFSIGFGPKLCSFKDKLGTEYQLALFPIGGYVRMLGEDPLAQEPLPGEREQSFSFAKPSHKIIIAAAGPAASLLLGYLLVYTILITGTRELEPFIGEVVADSPAELAGIQSGEEVLRVDGQEIESWQDVNLAFVERLGETGAISIETDQREYQIQISSWLSDQVEPDVVQAIGLEPQIRAHLSQIVPGSAADKAGFRVGDYISEIDGRSMDSWQDIVENIRNSAQQRLVVKVERDGKSVSLALTPDLITNDDGTTFGRAGFLPQVGRTVRYGMLEAIPRAFDDTLGYIVLTADSIAKIVTGDVHSANIGGPIRIAEFAGDMAEVGLRPYLMLLALLTIALGIINLLPIPMLDGGHVVYGVIELITSKPVPMNIQLIAMRVGLFIVGGIMIFALYNDVSRLVAS